MITKMDRSYLAALYFSGLTLAEVLRFPQRINRFRHHNIWRKPLNSTLNSETIVLISIVVGIWILPLTYSFSSWLSASNFSLPTWSIWAGIFHILSKHRNPLYGSTDTFLVVVEYSRDCGEASSNQIWTLYRHQAPNLCVFDLLGDRQTSTAAKLHRWIRWGSC